MIDEFKIGHVYINNSDHTRNIIVGIENSNYPYKCLHIGYSRFYITNISLNKEMHSQYDEITYADLIKSLDGKYIEHGIIKLILRQSL
jgi:hypothetical protein